MAASEAGGITQGIGAYKVVVPIDGKSQPCVFLDTPGHEVKYSLGTFNFKVLCQLGIAFASLFSLLLDASAATNFLHECCYRVNSKL